MKRMLCALCLLLMLVCAVPVLAESYVIAADEDDLVSMLEEVFEQSDFDYSCVTLNRKDKIIVVDVAIDGMTAGLLALKELGYDDTDEQWMQIKQVFVTMHESILEMFSTVNRDDMRLIFNVVNDDVYIREDYENIRYNPLLSIGIFGMVTVDMMAE